MTHIQSETIQFPAGNHARLIQAPEGATAGEIVKALELPTPRALLVLNGGTAELTEDLQITPILCSRQGESGAPKQ